MNVFSAEDEALVGQGQAALLAVEAVLVPGEALVVHHVGAMAEPCDGVLAAVALLGHVGLVAVHAEEVVLVGGEARPGQGLAAGAAHEALGVPGVVLVADAPGGDGLLAVETLLGKLLVMAGGAVDVLALCQEALGADGQLALEALEALLVPNILLVLHVLGPWHDHLVASLAPVAVLAGAALAAHDLAVVPGVEGLAGQRLVALGAAEAVLMPVAVFVVQLLGVGADGTSAFCAGVGADLVEALGAHVLLVLLHELLAVQVVAAVEAVEALRHGGGQVALRGPSENV